MTLDLCLEVVQGQVNHCVTFAIEYPRNRLRLRLVPKDHR